MKSISVIIPVYNGEKFIREAIETVAGQSHRPNEIIVVNDGSTDGTAAILDAIPGITVVHQENNGIGFTLNKGLDIATSDLVAFLDADDQWLPGKLAVQMAEFEQMNYNGIVFTQIEQFISDDVGEEIRSRIQTPTRFLQGVHRSTMLIDRQSLDKVGRFSNDYLSGEFLEWYLRAKEYDVPVRIIDQVFAKRRIHGNNTTLVKDRNSSRKYPLIIKQALERRRSAK